MSQDVTQISPEVATELRKIIDQSLSSQPPTISPPLAADAKHDFCGIWPTAKPVLQGLSGLVIFFPGFGQAAAAALTALIGVGDQIYKQTCGNN
ncbi:hypothetical protein ACX4M5_04590 [Roseomonas mucosa]